ncbi:hypothetical protein ACLMYS_003926 [Salmonella enterica]
MKKLIIAATVFASLISSTAAFAADHTYGYMAAKNAVVEGLNAQARKDGYMPSSSDDYSFEVDYFAKSFDRIYQDGIALSSSMSEKDIPAHVLEILRGGHVITAETSSAEMRSLMKAGIQAFKDGANNISMPATKNVLLSDQPRFTKPVTLICKGMLYISKSHGDKDAKSIDIPTITLTLNAEESIITTDINADGVKQPEPITYHMLPISMIGTGVGNSMDARQYHFGPKKLTGFNFYTSPAYNDTGYAMEQCVEQK